MEKKSREINDIILDAVRYFGSITTLAEYLGVSRESVSRWVNGHHSPNVRHYMKIEMLLNSFRKKKNGKDY